LHRATTREKRREGGCFGGKKRESGRKPREGVPKKSRLYSEKTRGAPSKGAFWENESGQKATSDAVAAIMGGSGKKNGASRWQQKGKKKSKAEGKGKSIIDRGKDG